MDQQVPDSVFADLEQQHQLTYATTGQRFANFLIDTVVFYIFEAMIVVFMGVFYTLLGLDVEQSFLFGEDMLSKATTFLFGSIIYFFVYGIMEGTTKGRSLGKLITGTKAVTEEGKPLTWHLAFHRALCRVVPLEPLSGFSGHPWHDTWTKTIVVKKRN